MEQGGLLTLISIGYIGLLFLIAWWGDRHVGLFNKRGKAWIYGLSLAVYCSSWSFLGTVGMSAESVWSFLPVYIAPIIMIAFAFPLLEKIATITKEQNITSIADFIASRYGKSQALGAIVTFISVVGVLPYIALQLKAIVNSFSIFDVTAKASVPWTFDMPLVVALVIAVFAILFGTRKLDATEHHPGMMLAIAFESIIKLAALLVVGVLVTYLTFNGMSDIWQQASEKQLINEGSGIKPYVNILTQVIVMAAAFLCMPRQFHVMMVECEDPKMLRRSRWVFPLYLVLAGLFVMPLALAGKLLLGSSVSADSYVINLPLFLDFQAIGHFAFLGAVSAATGMVIVASVTISIMVSNEWIIPLMLKAGIIEQRNFEFFSRTLLNIRRLVILGLLLLGWACYESIPNQNSLANLGLVAFGAFTQLLPGLVGGVYWKHGNRKGVFIGLAVGCFIWIYTLIRPLYAQAADLSDYQWLEYLQPSTQWILFSLCLNSLFYIWGSLIFRAGVRERMQAGLFVGKREREQHLRGTGISKQELLMLASRFVGPTKAYEGICRVQPPGTDLKLNWNKNANDEEIKHTELMLASVIGTSSASLVMCSVLEGRDMPLDDLVSLIDSTSSKIMASQNLMQGAIEHASEGISVIDENLKLMAWNKRYSDMFDYPPGFLEIGKPIEHLIRFNANRGFCGEGSVDELVGRRVRRIRSGTAYYYERTRPDGKVIKMQGNPMPDGGFVTTFSDITQYREVERELTRSKEELEARVLERTMELSKTNSRLTDAKARVEEANLSKTRFMAAIGHDLMQPLNAARLFTASLLQQTDLDSDVKTTVSHISDSLKASGQLLADLLDISKLESGAIEVNKSEFPISQLLNSFAAEFGAMSADYDIRFKVIKSSRVVHSDVNLLRRIIQNFLTNAFRYGSGAKVVLGCRRVGEELRIEVWDQGTGIPPDRVEDIFKEFKRLENSSVHDRNGLGLGLAIADRISKVLGHNLGLKSELHRGSVFSVTVPMVKNFQVAQMKPVQHMGNMQLAGVRVLCIDNEEKILAGLSMLLKRWQCEVLLAKDLEEAIELIDAAEEVPEIILADYHLDNDKSGLDAMDFLRERYGATIPGVLITADTRKELVEQVESKGYKYMAKMVRPAALRALMSGLLRTDLAS